VTQDQASKKVKTSRDDSKAGILERAAGEILAGGRSGE